MTHRPTPAEIGRPRLRLRERLGGLALHLVAGLLAALVLATPFVADLEQQIGLTGLFQLRGARTAPDTVAVVAIDGQAAQKLGLSLKPSDWPRALHARLIDALVRAGARVIVFDLTFATPGRQAEDDVELAAAMRRAGNVVLVAPLRRESIRAAMPDGIPTGAGVDRVVPPIPAIEQAALAHAPFPLPKAGRVDAFWAFIESAGDLPTLPMVALQAYLRDDLTVLLQRVDPRPHETPADGDSLFGSMVRLRKALAGHQTPSAGVLEPGTAAVSATGSATLRMLIDLYAGHDARFLDFYGPARTIDTLSYSAALEAASAISLDGRAVFVGFSGASAPEQDRVRDHYPSVYSRDDGVEISGVEIAATGFANLLEARSVHQLPLMLQMVLIALFGSALGALFLVLPQRHAYAALFSAGAAYLLAAHVAFASTALWLPLLVPLGLQLPFAALAGTWQRYRLVHRKYQALRGFLAKFLPPDIANELANEFIKTGQIRRPIHGVCLASDMEGYTQRSESLDPAALSELLNAYYAKLFGPVERYGGSVSDIVGDAMLAIWGAQQGSDEIRRDACLAALEIASLGRDEAVSPAGEQFLPTRIGLHAGQMHLVSVGASRHFEFRAVGDTVNTASRIEGLSKHLGTRLLVSAAVIAGLDEFMLRPLGSYILLGKSNPVRVFELVGAKRSVTSAAAQLCQDFSHALQLYEDGKWQDAAPLFARILERVPDDGPSRYFARRCNQHASDPRLHPWFAEIPMSDK